MKKVFYGWYIVGAAGLLSFFYGSAVVYGFTILLNPIATETGWSYTQLSLAASIRGTESAVLAPLMGGIADRWGPRRLVFCGSIVVSLGLFLLSRASTLLMLYLAFAMIALGSSGFMSTVIFVSVVHWFRKRIGKAIAIVSASAGVSGLTIPLLTGQVDTYGWRTVVLILACGMCVVGIPLSFVFRHRPEPYGLQPDGDVGDTSTAIYNPGNSDGTHDVGIRQAVKTRRFWQIVFAFMLLMMVIGALIVHIMPYLGAIGVARGTASLLIMGMLISSVASRLSFGWLIGLLEVKHLLSLALGLLVIGMGTFACFSSFHWLIVPSLVTLGIGYGSMFVLGPLLIRDQFGTSAFGKIFGVTSSAMMLGSIIGTPLAGWVFDTQGSYQPIWFIFTGILLLALLLIMTMSSTTNNYDI